MSDQLVSIPVVQTMDSREIAELTRKQHAHVCRDIQEMLSHLKGLNQSSFGSVYTAGNGEQRRCYRLPYRETMILVSGYSVELRSRVVDRWLELERASSVAPTGPRLLALALIEADRMLKEQAPKVEAFNHFIAAENVQTVGAVAKALGTGRNRLFTFLRERSIFMANGQPYQRFIEAGYFVVKEHPVIMGDRETNYAQPFITAKGVEWISRLMKNGEVA